MRAAIFERAKGDQKTAASARELRFYDVKSAAPKLDRKPHSVANERSKNTVSPGFTNDLGMVFIATDEWAWRRNLRRTEQAAVVHGFEMLPVESLSGDHEPARLGVIGE